MPSQRHSLYQCLPQFASGSHLLTGNHQDVFSPLLLLFLPEDPSCPRPLQPWGCEDSPVQVSLLVPFC